MMEIFELYWKACAINRKHDISIVNCKASFLETLSRREMEKGRVEERGEKEEEQEDEERRG